MNRSPFLPTGAGQVPGRRRKERPDGAVGAPTMPPVDQRWGRLAKAIDADRQSLRLSWAGLARAAGMSRRTLWDLRAGERTSYQAATLDALEAALRWEPGSVERVLSGRAPKRNPDPDWARMRLAWPDLPPVVRRTLADVAEGLRDA